MIPFEDLMWLFSSNASSRGIVRLNIAEGALLYKCCRAKKGAVLLEIGRKHGGSTAIMAAALDKGMLYSVDIVEHPESKQNTKTWHDKIKFVTANSKTVEWTTFVDLLFIDGDHSYEGVKNDVTRFTPFLRENGILIFHDVVGKKSVLQPIIDNFREPEWKHEASADSMLVLRKGKW